MGRRAWVAGERGRDHRIRQVERARAAGLDSQLL